jgi:two-component system, chemotaxis family, sensor kinase CheA
VNQFSDERGAELRELFFETAQELLQSLNDDALKLEKTPKDTEIIRSIRRTVHTLKGDAAACGFLELSELAHLMEDALAVEVTSSNVSLAELGFTAADTFGAMLIAYRQEGPLPETSPLRAMVQQFAAGAPAPSASAGKKSQASKKPNADSQQVAWTEYEKLAAGAAQAEGKKIFHIVAQIDPLCAMPIAARQLVANALGAVAQILGARPELGSAANVQKLDLLVATSQEENVIVAKCRIPTVISTTECFEFGLGKSGLSNSEAELKQAAAPAEEQLDPGLATAETLTGSRKSPLGETVLRVDAEKIDNVLNLVGELIIGKSMLQQVMTEYALRSPKDGLRGRFGDVMALQARVLNDLQRSVMKIRMVPVEQLFRRFPRIVRDAAQRCGRQVELVLSGQDTDLDKSLLDAIAEPLTHIVRNAVSHGLETPAEREQAGKPATGKIQLTAYHQANQLIVEVSDDGRGVDAAKLKAKAIKTKLIAAEAAERMSTAEALDLIFRPGFSTADEITEISGRGVGLDVVRSVLHRLKGTVELETHPGQGTRFRLKLPLTLAIIKALLFRVEHRLYAIPLNTVAEIARAWEADLHQVASWEVVQLREQAVPLMRLGKNSSGATDERRGKIFILVINHNDRKMGLIVDSLEGEEELVIKALDDQTIATDLVSGASILGDGRVVLIMNLAAVVERFTRSTADASQSGVLLADADRTGAAGLAEVRQ